MNEIIKIEKTVNIESKIISLPGRPNAMLASDLAEIYETETKYIVRALKRNEERFPEYLKCQSVTSNKANNSRPYLFTHNGANMLSAVQSSGGSYTQTYVTGRGLGWLKRRMTPETQQAITFN